MKILLVSSYLPYPLYSGGQVRLYNIIKELSKRYEITLVCERRPNETDADVDEVKKICKEVITVDRKKQWSFENILKASISSHSFLLTGHMLPEMRQKIGELLQKKTYDVIHVETFYVMQNVPETSVPIVLIEHNIEYKVYDRFKTKAPAPVRPVLAIDIRKIKNEEESFWQKATKVVAVSKADQSVIRAAGIHAEIVANGVNTDQFTVKNIKHAVQQKEKKILFIGDFKWLQNKDSAAFILREVWPLLKSKNKNQNIKLWIVARNIPESITALSNDPDVLFDKKSSAKATPKIFREASVLLAPIRVGGGTSYKILESMSCGTPVITMPLSADALEAKDGEEILVGASANALADKTIEVLHNAHLYEQISKKGRMFIEKKYTWKEIAKALNAVYSSAV